jgi:hypothetical protein
MLTYAEWLYGGGLAALPGFAHGVRAFIPRFCNPCPRSFKAAMNIELGIGISVRKLVVKNNI